MYARGTAHLKLLRQAYRNIDKSIRNIEKQLKRDHVDLDRIIQERQRKIHVALEKHIAYTHLDEVPGIGPKLRSAILSGVFRSRLNDLKRAYIIRGIGQTKQRQINNWIQMYQKRIPRMIEEDFPGKGTIRHQYQKRIVALESRIKENNNKRAQYEQSLSKAREEIEKLETVSIKNFREKLLNPEYCDEKIENYLRGVFSEWEEMPDWFKNILTIGGEIV